MSPARKRRNALRGPTHTHKREAVMCTKQDTMSSLLEALRDAEKAGVTLEDILKCLNTKTKPIRSVARQWRYSLRNSASFIFLQLMPALSLVFLLHFPLMKLLSGASCLLPAPVLLRGMIHPLANCSACQGVTEAPRLLNLTPKDFALHHAYSSRPIVVAEAALHWPAMHMFSYEYFRSLYYRYPDAIGADTSKGQFFSYSANIRNLKELFELPSERVAMTTERWYIGW